MKVVITDHDSMTFEDEKKMFASVGADLYITQCETEKDVIESAKGAIAIMNSYVPITRRMIEALPDLQIIAKYSNGVDNIDVEAATEHNVYVANVPDYCQEDVSNHTLALILNLNRKISLLNQTVKGGRWSFSDAMPMHRFSILTVGLISYGRNAQALAKKLTALDFQLMVYDPYNSEKEQEVAADFVSLKTLMQQSDIISIHAPLNEETYHLINRDKLQYAKPGAMIVNTGRGSVVCEDDLIEALNNGVIAAAALDVVEDEPIKAEHSFLSMDNVVLTPHTAFYSEESFHELQQKTAANVMSVLEGKEPIYAVNRLEVTQRI